MEDIPLPPYTAWLHWNVTYRCNLACPYCFYVKARDSRPSLLSLLSGARKVLEATPSLLKDYADAVLRRPPSPIRIPELLKTLEKTGHTFKIDFTGGEPFLIPNFIEACAAIAQRHYIVVNTNLTSRRIPEFARRIPPHRVKWIDMTLHFSEMERLGMMPVFIENFRTLHDAGFPMRGFSLAFPPLAAEAQKRKETFLRKGIPFMYLPYFGLWKGRLYPRAYTPEEIRAFDLDVDRMTPPPLCIAGHTAAVAFPGGDVVACAHRKVCLGNVYRRFSFRRAPLSCPIPSCVCCFPKIDPALCLSSG